MDTGTSPLSAMCQTSVQPIVLSVWPLTQERFFYVNYPHQTSNLKRNIEPLMDSS